MSTWQLNERKKKFECHMKPKNQQENEEYNEDKKQQIALKEKKLKKKEKRERREPGTVDGVLKVKTRR